MRHQSIAVVGIAAALCLAPRAAAQSTPRFVPTPCHADYAEAARRVDCGFVALEETRGSGNGRRVVLPVAIVRADHPKPGLPPVFFIHGGPGGDTIQGLAERLAKPIGKELIARDQDWIFFDHRGSKNAVPDLDCGELDLNDAGPLSPAAAGALEACGARFAAAGVDLARYNAIETARDLQDIRRALKIDRFDLFGGSYGTRVEFSIIAREADGLRAAVLDSVWPQDANWAIGGPQMVSTAVDAIVARCGTDASCRRAFPRLSADLERVTARFLAGPVKGKNTVYGAGDLGGFLMDTIYDADGARALPRDLHRLATGNYAALDAHRDALASDGYSEAQHLAFLCKERFAFERADAVGAAAGDKVSQLLVPSFRRYFDVCRAYPVGAPDARENAPVSSALPVFMLSAEFDPGCPPELARAAISRFPNGQLVMFPNTTHGVASHSVCARTMIRAFLADPMAPLDKSCLKTRPDRFAFTLR